MDSEFFARMVEQIPGLAVLVYVVINFSRNARSAMTDFILHLEKRDEVLKELRRSQEKLEDRAIDVISKNTEMLAEVKVWMQSQFGNSRKLGGDK